MDVTGIEQYIVDHRTNAVLGWLVVAGMIAGSAISVHRGELLWAAFAVAVALVVVAPAIAHRSLLMLPPWEIVAIAGSSVVARVFVTGILTGKIATYLSVAALALLVAVDLAAFTPVRMNNAFALLFVVLTTMAAAGLWAVVRYLADVILETGFLQSEHALMVEFVSSTVAGVLAGVLFVLYIRHRTDLGPRLPREVDLP